MPCRLGELGRSGDKCSRGGSHLREPCLHHPAAQRGHRAHARPPARHLRRSCSALLLHSADRPACVHAAPELLWFTAFAPCRLLHQPAAGLSTGGRGHGPDSCGGQGSPVTLARPWLWCSPLSLCACAGVLVFGGAVNSLPSKTLPKLGAVSLMWTVVLITTMTLLIPLLAPVHQSPKLVWGTFYGTSYSTSGITSNPYIFMQASLLVRMLCLSAWLRAELWSCSCRSRGSNRGAGEGPRGQRTLEPKRSVAPEDACVPRLR